MPIHCIVVDAGFARGIEVRDDLVPEEIEVHPFGGASTFGAAEQLAIEAARGGEVVYRNGEVERLRH